MTEGQIFSWTSQYFYDLQECIPVGCVPSATIAVFLVGGGGGVAFCYGLLVWWPFVMAFWLKGVSVRRDPPPSTRRPYQKAITEDHFQLEGHSRRPPNQTATPEGHPPGKETPLPLPRRPSCQEGPPAKETPQEQAPPETCCKARWDSTPPCGQNHRHE